MKKVENKIEAKGKIFECGEQDRSKRRNILLAKILWRKRYGEWREMI